LNKTADELKIKREKYQADEESLKKETDDINKNMGNSKLKLKFH